MKLLAYILFAGTMLGQQPGWFSEREYENVKVTFDYKLAQWAEASFVLRTPRIGRPIQQGVAIFLAHDFHQKMGLYVTGSVAGFKAPTRLLTQNWGAWHSVELEVERLRALCAEYLANKRPAAELSRRG